MFHCIVLGYSREVDDVSGICLTPVSTPSLHTSLLRTQTPQILLIFTLFWGKTVSFTSEEFGNRSLFMSGNWWFFLLFVL